MFFEEQTFRILLFDYYPALFGASKIIFFYFGSGLGGSGDLASDISKSDGFEGGGLETGVSGLMYFIWMVIDVVTSEFLLVRPFLIHFESNSLTYD